MNVELKRIAEKKLEQMGATVHGVLVKNEAGAWAAVSEGGRVMWLDDFEGQPARAQGGQGAEPAGSLKSCACQFDSKGELLKECLFHKARCKPQQGSVPEIIKEIADKLEKVEGESADGGYMWDARDCAEFIRDEADKLATTPQSGDVQIPKTARKLIAEVVGSDAAHELICRLGDHLGIYEDVYEQIVEMIEPHVCREGINSDGPLPASVVGSVELLLKHYLTHPQPAQQGSVPEDVVSALESVKKRIQDSHTAMAPSAKVAVQMVVEALRLEAESRTPMFSTPQTEGDGWVKCIERLPTEADDDFNGCVWARFEDGDIDLMETEEVEQTWDDDISITHWMPTGLKRPQPPKEGKGDE